jgi:Mor family transcriptional regulator
LKGFHTVRTLIIVSDIVDILGGTASTAALCGYINKYNVHLWIKKNEIPALHHFTINTALAQRGVAIDNAELSALFHHRAPKLPKLKPPGRGHNKKPDRNAEIIERYTSGESAAVLAKHYRLSRERVRQIVLPTRLVRPPGRQAERNAERNAEIIEGKRRGESIAALAERFGLSSMCVYQILRPTGLTALPCQDERDAEIVERKKRGESVAALANAYGLSIPRLYKIIHANGASDAIRSYGSK